MLAWIKQEYWLLHGTFHDSSVIVWSRVQVTLGIVWCGLQNIDASPFLTNPKHLAYWMIFSNIINELLRRNGAEYHDDGRMR